MSRLVAQMTTLLVVMVMAVSASADDAQIAKLIISQLSQQKQAANLKGFDLGVQVDKGTVTMMGQVSNSEQAMLALDIARRVSGVKLVVNDLYVNQVAPQVATPVARPAIQQVAAQQYPLTSVLAQRQPAYNQTGSVGSAIAPRSAPAVPQRPVPMGRSNIQRAGYASPIARADYVEGMVGGDMGGGMAPSDGGQVVGGGPAYGGSESYGASYGGVSENPQMPAYAYPSYSAHPNYGSVAYPKQYSATAWPYIGPFYPYPQVPLGWRKVSLEWDDGWWFLDFDKK